MTVPDPGVGYIVTLKDVSDGLNKRVDDVVGSLHQIDLTLATLKPAIDQGQNHEARLQVLERFRYVLIAVGASSGSGVGWLTSFLYHLSQARH